MKNRNLSLRFPLGGLSKKHGFQSQAPYTTPSALNFWPFQSESGRERGGTRPGIVSFTGAGGIPYHSCPASWEDGTTTYDGLSIATSTGVWVHNGTTWANRITVAPGQAASTAVYLQSVFLASGSDGEIRYYDLSGGAGYNLTDEVDAGTDKGTAPLDCYLAVAWGDRVWFANAHLLYGCRVGDFLDYNYDKVDGSAAVSLSGEDGIIDEPISALIPHNRQVLIVGGTDSMSVQRGNPTAGGSRDTISNIVGPITNSAWTKMPDGSTLMMTRDGLYTIPAGAGSSPQAVSRQKLPADLVGISPEDGDYVSMAIDVRWQGVHIYAEIDSTNVHYFFDYVNGGFWPMDFSVDMRLAANYNQFATADKSGLIAMSTTASYQFDRTNTDSIDSHVVYGPIVLGGPIEKGSIAEVVATLAEDSDDVSWELFVGNSAQEAFAKVEADDPDFTGADWDIQGYNYSQYPRVGGNVAYLKVYSESSNRISLEEIGLRLQTGGKRRI